MQNLLWAGSSTVIKKISGSDTFDHIPAGVWELQLSMMGPYLQKVSDNFHFGHKIYGLEEDFINYTLRSFDVAEKNLGILLNGLKGCGKTVTAKILANRVNLPVILVDSSNIGALDFFNDVTQSLCFMFDEFEKIVDHKDMEKIAPLLSFVDGTVTVAKHMMIFTSNDTNISEFFIDRPGRIRYIKNYGSLSIETVKEIINDKLVHTEFKQDILDWVMFFKFLTIDILMSVINEVNIHKVGPSAFKQIFNADNDKPSYDVKIAFMHPITKEVVEFEYDTILNYSPSEYFEDIVDRDTSMRVLGYEAVADIKTNELVNMSSNYASSIYFNYVEGIKDLPEEDMYTCKIGFDIDRPGSTARKSNLPENTRKIILNDTKTGFLEQNVIYTAKFTFKARPLYKSYNTFAF